MSISLLPARTPLALLCWLGGAAAALFGSALIAQYGFGMRPCHLCIWQRWPYGILIALAALALLFRNKSCHLSALVWMALALLTLETGIAAYHSAVERHWIAGPTECTGNAMDANASIEDIRAKILGAALTRCDEAAWMLPGISMANANFGAALAMLVITFQRRPRRKDA